MRTKNRIRIEVTNGNLYFGESGSPTKCPIARALHEAGYEDVNVQLHNLKATEIVTNGDFENRQPFIATLPQRAQRFVENFDDGKPVKPFVFHIQPVYKPK